MLAGLIRVEPVEFFVTLVPRSAAAQPWESCFRTCPRARRMDVSAGRVVMVELDLQCADGLENPRHRHPPGTLVLLGVVLTGPEHKPCPVQDLLAELLPR